MKKSLGALKEKFGKFEVSKEQQRKVVGGHCPTGISYDWCERKWCTVFNNDEGGITIFCQNDFLNACIATCVACKKCNQPAPEYAY
jgi:hypothetical protein